MDSSFVYSVSQLVYEIKTHIEDSYKFISVEGEISNLSKASSGHYYFSLSDNDALITSALFKMDSLRNPIMKNLKNGDKVIVSGQVNLYPKKSNLQIIAKRILPAGEGKLKLELERLKLKLKSEGLFDIDTKMKIPAYPKRIGLITAADSAAYSDFIKIVERRDSSFSILFYPVLVQGENAPASLIKAIRTFKKYNESCSEDKKVDVIVLMRGGGSLEDLWAFNDEKLARELYSLEIPTISAVGHEIDFSITDYIADMRCETPSAAAEILSENYYSVAEKLNKLGSLLKININSILKKMKFDLENLSPHKVLENVLNPHKDQINRFHKISKRFSTERLLDINAKIYLLDEIQFKLHHEMKRSIDDRRSNIDKMTRVLFALDPKNVLGRGYSYLTDTKAKLISGTKKFDQLKKDATIYVHFKDGKREVCKNE